MNGWLVPDSGTAGWLLAAITLLLAFCIDRVLGEPPTAVHPVVWMGRYLGAWGRLTVRCRPVIAFLLGALAWCLGALAVAVVAWRLQVWALWHIRSVTASTALGHWAVSAALVLAMAWLLKAQFSWRMLREETAAVDAALQQSLTQGRERLSWLVSRDTTQLSASEVRESAIESLAENLNDSVVAPVFWFVLLGLPGAAVYRFANTADAMWGYPGVYKGHNWQWAGKWAARADDVLSWLPARITAVLLLLVARRFPLAQLRAEACKTPSPNSGWPMAAMALVLGASLRKPGVYVLNPAGRPPEAPEMVHAGIYASKVVGVLVTGAFLAMVLIALWPSGHLA